MSALRDAAFERIRTIAASVPRDDGRMTHGYSLAGALRYLATPERARGPQRGFELDVHQQLLKDTGATLQTSNSLLVPWAALGSRAVTVGSSAAGGYLVDTETLPAQQALGSMSIVGSLATVLNVSGGNFSVPIIKTPATAQWLPSETTATTESDETFGQANLTPHTVAAYTEVSRLLLLQSDADSVVSRDVGRAVGRAADKGYLVGTGANGQPTGLAKAAGTQSFTGTSATLSALTGAVLATGDALDQGSKPAFVGSRSAANTLRGRAEISGTTWTSSRTLWQGPLEAGSCVDYPAFSTTNVTSGDLYFGNWAYALVLVWGALEIAVNPYANFQNGVVGVRAMLTTDVAYFYPGAFAVNSNSIS